MKYLTIVSITLFANYILLAQALECNIKRMLNKNELQEIVDRCIEKKQDVNKTMKIDTASQVTTIRNFENYNNMKQRNKRNSNNNNNRQQIEIIIDQINLEANDTNKTSNNNNCTLSCIFALLDIVDNNGYPEHNRVSQALLKNVNGQELKDFIQDAADECFQLLDQGEKQEVCQYSITLVKCLAERGKANCADWPIGNSSIFSKNY